MNKIPRVRLPKFPEHAEVISDVILNNNYVSGPQLRLFSDSFCKSVNTKSAAFTSNGFSALLLTLKALGLFGKRILVPSVSTCFATVNAVKASGNTPVFCNLDVITLGLDINSVRSAYSNGGFDAIINVSHFGIVKNNKELMTFKVPVIEDASQSIHSVTNAGLYADATVFSFYPTKALNAIDGGAVACNDLKVIDKVNKLSYYEDQLEFVNEERFNYRFLNLHAAFGLVSISYLEETKKKLKKIAELYKDIFDILEIDYFEDQFKEEIVPLKMLLRIKNVRASHFYDVFSKAGIAVSKELVSLQSSYGDPPMKLLCDELWSIPFYENLTQDELNTIMNTLKVYAKN
jgi:perosamine synthetase